MPSFVILEHQWEGVHWDLMLQVGEVLRTWAIDRPIRTGVELPARRLSDHRLAYLDYEGAVSRGRGTVSRLDRGLFELVSWSEYAVRVDLRGEQFLGRVTLWLVEDQRAEEGEGETWRFRFEAGNVDCKTLREGNLGD